MKLRYLLALLPVALAGCQAVSAIGTVLSANGPNPVTPQTVYELRLSYDSAEAIAIAYIRRPLCPAPGSVVCSKASVSVQLKSAGPKARLALNTLQTFSTQHPTLDATAYYQAAVQAIGVVQQLAAQ